MVKGIQIGEMTGDFEQIPSTSLRTHEALTSTDNREYRNTPPAETYSSLFLSPDDSPKFATASKNHDVANSLKRSLGDSGIANTNNTLIPKRLKRDIELLKAELVRLEEEEAQSIRDLEEARQKKKMQRANREVSLNLDSQKCVNNLE